MPDINITDKELLDYVLLPINEYEGSIKALQMVDIITDVLDRCPEAAIPNIIRLVLGKKLQEEGEIL